MAPATPEQSPPAPADAVAPDDAGGAQASSAPPARVGILGSCVSRDTLETMPKAGWEVVTYVARTSILSAGSDARRHAPAELTVPSEFQRRNVLADLEGRILPRLAEHPIDLLVWDLVDERHGILRFPDGAVMTPSVDAIAIPELEATRKAARAVPFGTDEHFQAWSASAAAFADGLAAIGLRRRTLVLAPDWALAAADGASTPWSMGVRPSEANERFPRYFDRLGELGFEVARFSGLAADQHHRWGFAAFHFDAAAYEQLAKAIKNRLDWIRENA